MNQSGLFPPDFLWGAATSAYQIEGSPSADGAGASIWHRFSATPGRVENGDTGDIACDHYRRYPEDVALMRSLGLRAYRFSIAWGRILPTGTGALNEAGIDFYSRLVDALLEAGIEPWPTLYHWDLPADLDDRGGWLNPDIAGWFADYTAVVVRRLGDRVRSWMTVNEPWVVADAGYLHGVHAPGRAGPYEAARAAINLLRSHGRSVAAARAAGAARVGLVVNLAPKHPASESEEDKAAAVRGDAYMNRQYLDPVFLGSFPEELPAIYGPGWPGASAAELALMRAPIDFLGINYYTRNLVRRDPARPPVCEGEVRNPRAEYTTTGWEVYPDGLTEILRWVAGRYPTIDLYVTENGAAFADPPTADSEPLSDPRRVAYYRAHLLAARRAIAAGVPLRGYFAWSLLDNFEWACGYSKRFGLVHVDFATQRRTMKASGLFYRDVIASNGGALDA